MARAKRLIIGLGNPGAQYEGTRHNVGFEVVEALAAQADLALAHEAEALVGWGRHRGCSFGVAMPLTYMNRSGQSVRKLMGRHGLTPADLLVVYDDLNLEPGRLRLRPQGSAGGHNGLQDIIDRLGTREVARLRIGIGDDFRRGRQVDYVLEPFSAEQRPLIDEAVVKAQEAALTFACQGLDIAMNRYN